MRWWAFWRRLQYAFGFFSVVALIGVGGYYQYWYVGPTCFDLEKNGEEHGVDCGGVCTRICSFEISMPTALWTESFKIIDGQYNAVSYIENRNKNVGTPKLQYVIKLYDAKGVIAERSGITVLPPDSVYPIFEGKIITGDRTPTKTTIELTTDDVVWLPGSTGRDQFMLERRDLANVDSKPTLTAQLSNTSLDEARDVEVVATIFDSRRNPLTASRTFIPYFTGRTSQEVVFTWPEPIAKTLRSCETPTDVVLAIDLSGSMNNDGGTPPEPVSSVLSAAEAFVGRLKEQDQVSIVTYASNATIIEQLTHENEKVADIVSTLRIDPKEEQGSTNIGDALLKMREELSSSRHNQDARKVAILLTDGLATAPEDDPELYAETEAEALKGVDAQLYTIGLGASANEEFLKNIASTPALYYKAPTKNDLGTIYTAITGSICEDGATVIEIIPKAQTSFTELK